MPTTRRKSMAVDTDLIDINGNENIKCAYRTRAKSKLEPPIKNRRHSSFQGNSKKKVKSEMVKKEIIASSDEEPPIKNRRHSSFQGNYKEVKLETVKNENIASSDEEDNDGLTPYERKIQQNILDRHKILEELNLFNIKNEFSSYMKPKVKPKTNFKENKPVKKPITPLRRRSSLRIKIKEEEREQLKYENETNSARSYPKRSTYFEYKELDSDLPEPEDPEDDRPPPGPCDVMEYYKLDDDKNECSEFMSSVKKLSNHDFDPKSCWGGPLPELKNVFSSMNMREEDILKVIPTRCFSSAFYPSAEKSIICLGGKKGELGIYDLDYDDYFYFNIHGAPINYMEFDRWNTTHLYSTSYDGSFRRLDFSNLQLEQKYDYSEGYRNALVSFCQPHRDVYYLSTNKSSLINVDTRSFSKQNEFSIVSKKVCVRVLSNPTDENYLVTSGSNELMLWDTRNLESYKPVFTLSHGGGISGIDFSKSGKMVLSTCNAGFIGVVNYSSSNLSFKKTIRYNTNTGRWLTRFRAKFLPGRDDMFYIGSMDSERKICLIDTNGNVFHNFIGGIATVQSVITAHPNKKLIIGVNSSGRVHLIR